MVLVQILKRKDASSIVVAVVVAMIISQVLGVMSNLAGWLSGLHNGQYPGYSFPGSGWKGEYLYPFVLAILQLLLLEVLVRVYIWAASMKMNK